MSHPIPPEAQRLANRLRMLAEEIESAARYGVPIPYMVSSSGHAHGRATFAATPEEFAAWADYTEAEVSEYDHAGRRWLSAEVDLNGLPLQFSAAQS
jgi:hypothetical protein